MEMDQGDAVDGRVDSGAAVSPDSFTAVYVIVVTFLKLLSH